MQILVDSNNLIVGYADIGGIDGGIEVSNSILPNDFVPLFKPYKFLFTDGKVEYNKDYDEDEKSKQLKNENISLAEKVVKLEEELQKLKNGINPPE